MEILQSDCETIRLNLSRGELVFVNNILNEVCNGFRVPDFVEQVGINLEDARKLLARVHDLAEYLPDNGDQRTGIQEVTQNTTTLELTRGEVMAIRNALHQTFGISASRNLIPA
jgi:uncharacterized protein YheU (UPF0270 family)